MPRIRHPIDSSATPPSYPLPPPALDEHGEQIRAWLAAPPGPLPPRGRHRRAHRRERAHDDQPPACPVSRPRWAPPTPDTITLLGQDLAADLMGKVGSASWRSGW